MYVCMCVSVFVVCAQILMRNFNSEEIKLAKTTKIQTQRKIFVFFLYLINKNFSLRHIFPIFNYYIGLVVLLYTGYIYGRSL